MKSRFTCIAVRRLGKGVAFSQEWLMNLSSKRKNVLPIWSASLVLFTVATVASAQHRPGAPAPAPHAAPAQRPPAPGGGNANPYGQAGANNRGPGGGNANPHGQAGANNRGPGGGNANPHGQAGANNRGPGGGNANIRGQAGPNNRGPGGGNANNRGQAGANNRGPGGANANNRGPGGANRHQPAGTRQVALKNGGQATFRRDGKVRSIQTPHGMRIEHGMRGARRIEGMHDGRRVVSMGRRGGYSERSYYNHGGRSYVQRTYYVGGQRYAYGYLS